MKKQSVFRGVATALVTPMNIDGSVDYESFGRLIDWQISSGVKALVIAGTTGEGSTLSDEEHRKLLKYSVDRIRHRVPMIAATGSNDTDYAIDLSRFACDIGSDALLCVTPYYNKATQKGLVRMYEVMADAVTKPIILYNVPSRTGINIEPETYEMLADHPNICGIKEANGNISKIVETMALVGDKLDLYSGNDDQIVPILSMGGSGVISVLSNVLPAQTQKMCDLFFEGDVKGSAALQLKYMPLIHSLFCEVNPIPVKAAMAELGYGADVCRLPLTSIEADHKQVLIQHMHEAGAFAGA